MLCQQSQLKKIIKASQVMVNGNIHRLPTSKQGKGHYLPILEAMVGQLDAMLSHHCKVLVFRVDLRLYQGTADNIDLSEFVRRFRSWSRRQNLKRLGFIWCREQQRSDVQHYHCAFMVDGNRYQRSQPLISEIRRLWQEWEVGTIYTPKNCYTMLKRDDTATYQQVFDRLSYLGKVATKQQRPLTTNDYSASRIKAKDASLT